VAKFEDNGYYMGAVNSRGAAESSIPGVTIFDENIIVPISCVPQPVLARLSAEFKRDAPRANFLLMAAALALCCSNCIDIRSVGGEGRKEIIRLGHKVGCISLLTIPAKADTRPAFGWRRSFDPSFLGEACSDPFHRLLVHFLTGALRGRCTLKEPTVSPKGIEGRLTLSVDVRRPLRTDCDTILNQMVRDGFDSLLDCFHPRCPERARGEYPYLPWDTICGWKTLAADECSTPADLLRFAERCTAEHRFEGDTIDSQVEGITLPLKRHQRHSVSLMLHRERVGHSDSIAVEVPTGATLHLNFLAGSLTYDAPQWPKELPPPSCRVRGGILADEMGLGKTLAVLTLARLNPPRAESVGVEIDAPAYFERDYMLRSYTGPAAVEGVASRYRVNKLRTLKATLVVVPVSITGQWMAEIARCSPSSRTLLFHGMQRNNFSEEDFAAADFVITTYETLMATIQLEQRSSTVVYDAITDVDTREAIDRVRLVAASERAERVKLLKTKGQDRRAAASAAGKDPVECAEASLSVLTDAQRKRHNSSLFADLCEANKPRVRITHMHFHRIVFDECQKASNSNFGDCLHASHVWATSGTPVDSSVAPLRQLCGIVGWNIVGPHAIFTNQSQFASAGNDTARVKTQTSQGTAPAADEITARELLSRNSALDFPDGALAPVPAFADEWSPASSMWAWAVVASHYIVRHSKNASVTEEIGLPPRTIEAHVIQMTDDERGLYAEVESRVVEGLKGLMRRQRLGSHAGSMLQWIDLLRRAAAHPTLVDQSRADGGQAATAAASMAQALENAGNSADSEAKAEEAAVAAGVSRGYLNENKKFGITPVPVAKVLAEIKAKKHATCTLELLEAMCRIPPEVGDCSVCLDRIQLPTLMPCGHCYCRECVLRVVSEALRSGSARRCPDCRSSIDRGLKQLVLADPVSDEAKNAQEAKEREERLKRVKHGSKVSFMAELIRKTLADEPAAKFVVFSTFPALMRIAAAALAEASISHCVIDGATSLPKRNSLIRAFQGGDLVACIISSRVGNAGLTLTAANHLILLEPNINVAVDAQAMGRIHRFGQTRPVTIHRIVAEHTAEQRIQVLVDSGRLDLQDQHQSSFQRNAGGSSKLGLEQMQFVALGDRLEEARAEAMRHRDDDADA